MAVSKSGDEKLHLCNTDPRFVEHSVDISGNSIKIEKDGSNWSNYFLCGVKVGVCVRDKDKSRQLGIYFSEEEQVLFKSKSKNKFLSPVLLVNVGGLTIIVCGFKLLFKWITDN